MRFFAIIFQISLIIFGCGAPTDFQSNCKSAAKILREAEKRIETVSAEEDPKSNTIIVKTDNSKAIEYLKSNFKVLSSNYLTIKAYYIEGNEYSFDALCAMALINWFKYYQDGNPFEDRCKYIRFVVEQKSENTPSDWLLNEFYHYLFTPPGSNDTKWLKMSVEEKYARMIKSLLFPDDKGANCINTRT